MQAFLDQDRLIDELLSTAGSVVRGESDWSALDASIDATVAARFEAPFLWLRSRLGLSRTEERIVWLLLAHELDATVRLALRAFNTEQTCDLALDTLRRLVHGDGSKLRAWRELGASGRLRRLGLIERTDGELDVPEQRQTFKLARRVLALAHGELGLDPDMANIASLHRDTAELERLVIPGSVEAELRELTWGSDRRIVILRGRAGTGRRSTLVAIAKANKRKVIYVDAAKLSSDRARAARELRALAREGLLLDRLLLMTNLEILEGSAERPDRMDLFESELDGMVLATSTKLLARRWTVSCTQLELPRLAHRQIAGLWRAALEPATESDAELLATTYPMSPALIDAAAKAAVDAAAASPLTPEHIRKGIRSVLDGRIASLAKRLEITQTWDDVVLTVEQRAAITELLARVRSKHRVFEDWGFGDKVGKGLGVSVLFSGPPGTGKTMLAGLIAEELQLEIYQVDVSRITSKWIGETGKNLAALFDAAEAGHAILLFDEADALFGKRTDVKSSNDRHANQEVNFLLQRLESFTGICLLTSNHESNIDPAFQRRLSLHLRFNVPDEDEREKLWRAMLPAQAPVDASVDFAGLARRYAMTGGYIKNAALRAAFLAADEGRSIGDAHLEYAARLEYEGMGKIAMPAASWPARVSATL